MRNYPSVSIVIPAYDAQYTIARCLRSIKSLDYPQDKLEVVIVDNGSTDDTAQIVKDLGFTVESLPEGNVGAVRNYGAKIAKGEVIAHTDSDCILPRLWLANAVYFLYSNSRIGAVGGGCAVLDDATLLEKAWVSVQKEKIRDVKYLPACNFILRKSLFDLLGGFNDKITAGEDDDLSVRISEAGLKMVSIKDCYVFHLGYPKTYYEIFKRQVWHGKSALDLSGTTATMLWATLIFCGGLLSCLLLAYFQVHSLPYWAGAIGLVFLMPFLMTLKKMRNSPISVQQFLLLVTIFISFFTGRLFGLIIALKIRWFQKIVKQ